MFSSTNSELPNSFLFLPGQFHDSSNNLKQDTVIAPLPLNLFCLLRHHESLAHELHLGSQMLISPFSHMHQYYQLLSVCDKGKEIKGKTPLMGCRPKVRSRTILHSHSSSHSRQFKQQNPKQSQEVLSPISNKDLWSLLCVKVSVNTWQRRLWLQLFAPFASSARKIFSFAFFFWFDLQFLFHAVPSHSDVIQCTRNLLTYILCSTSSAIPLNTYI